MIYNALTYGYSNARIKALAAQLLDRTKIERMIRADSVDLAISVLTDSTYSSELNELAIEYEGASLAEHATIRHFARVLSKILKMAPSESRVIIETLLTRWDIQDIKTILLTKHLRLGEEEALRLLMVCGTFTQDEIEGMLRADSVPSVVKYLGNTVFGLSLHAHVADYEHGGDINSLLAELDKIYLLRMEEAVYETDDRLVKALLKADVDARNLMTILRCRSRDSCQPHEIMSWIVPAGNLGLHELEPIVLANDWRPLVAKIGDYDLTLAEKAYGSDNDLTHFEYALEDMVMRHVQRTFRQSVLSLGVIVGFIYIKEDETRRIRRIIRGVEHGLSPEKIRESIYRTI